MKKTAIFLFLIFMLPVLAVGQVSFGKPEKINENWRFILQDVKNGEEKNFNDSRWEKIDLPHDWSVKGLLSPTLASCTGYLPGGIGWYRKTLNIPKERENEKVYLYFEGVYNRSEVFVNGHSIGKRPNGYISFLYDATPYVVFGEDNVIAVRVDHSRSADSRWYTGSGIYRNVWAVYSNPVHVAQWGVYAYPTRNKNQHSLNMEIEIENETSTGQTLTVVNELLDKNKKVVARSSRKIQTPANQSIKLTENLKVKNPSLWSLEIPYLYELRTTLLQNGKVIDSSTVNTGFRYFTFDPDKGFALNDTWMKVKGVCLHHDAGVLGSAVYRDVWKRRLLNLKEIGVNAIRTSHNPQAPDIYQLCDELGMLVIDEAFDEWEFPKRKWIEGWNKGMPGFQGTFDFFEEWGEKDLADMVRRDRNHLSVFAWSVGNEVDYPNDPYSHPILEGDKEGFTQPIFGGYKKDAPDAMRLGAIAKKLVAVVKQYDKSRPTTAGLAGVAMSNETEYPGALDIAGYNYTESMYDRDHKKYPQRVIFGSENRHELSAWKAARDKDFIFGQFLWTGIDY
ncbi:MAG TPA: glycoside hydrolase family 2 TIM barrel-domain containing protein, partial [Paludibacteraceae bacterium]|nr:glycoside hydrolase family 2 TIM barrel-domain containing protein [Paludibacteraceae bacterium]